MSIDRPPLTTPWRASPTNRERQAAATMVAQLAAPSHKKPAVDPQKRSLLLIAKSLDRIALELTQISEALAELIGGGR